MIELPEYTSNEFEIQKQTKKKKKSKPKKKIIKEFGTDFKEIC